MLLLHFKKEQLLAPRLPAELRPRVAWAEWGPVPPPMRGGVPQPPLPAAPRATWRRCWRSPRDAPVAGRRRRARRPRVGVVPNAIDPARFKPLPEEGAAHRARARRAGRRLPDRLPDPLQRQKAQRRGDRSRGAAGERARPARAPADDRRGRDRGRAARAGGAARRGRPLRADQRRRAGRAAVGVRRRGLLPLADRGRAAGDLDGHADRAPRRGHRRRGRHRLLQPGAGAIAAPDHDAAAVCALLAGYRPNPARARAEGRAAREPAAARHDPAVVGERAEAL